MDDAGVAVADVESQLREANATAAEAAACLLKALTKISYFQTRLNTLTLEKWPTGGEPTGNIGLPAAEVATATDNSAGPSAAEAATVADKSDTNSEVRVDGTETTPTREGSDTGTPGRCRTCAAEDRGRRSGFAHTRTTGCRLSSFDTTQEAGCWRTAETPIAKRGGGVRFHMTTGTPCQACDEDNRGKRHSVSHSHSGQCRLPHRANAPGTASGSTDGIAPVEVPNID